ncbi:hypothetical protein J3R83DRAFT_7315 [Lanmaoa asiatica]|nr:hypothetical protein J3R83DRAFT_7315 [Lanmaoa asiatica]
MSYDYWWPYYAEEDTPTVSPSLTTTSDADPDATVSAQDVVLSSDIPTTSLIQITALPPATTSPQAILPKLPYHRQLNILYLVPLFVALGVVLGAITSRNLVQMANKSTSFAPYFNSPAWSSPTYTQTIIPSNDGERFRVVTQEDPFLATPQIAMRQSPRSSNDICLPKIRISPSLPDPSSGDNSAPIRPAPSARKEYTVLIPDDEPANRVGSLETTKMTALGGESRSRSIRRSLGGGSYIDDTVNALGLLGSQDDNQDLVDAPVVLPKQALRLKEGALSSPTRESPKETIYSEDQSINTGGGNEIEEEIHSDIYTKVPQRYYSRTPHKRLSTGDASRRSSAPDTHASVLPLSPPSLMSPPLEKSLFFTSSLSSGASLASHMNTLAAISSSSLHHVDKSPELALFPLPSKKTKATRKLRTGRSEPPLPYPSYPDHLHTQPTPGERATSADTKRRSVSPGSPKPKGRSTSATHRESTTGICLLGSLSPTSLAIALASSSSSDMLNKVN